MSKHFEPTIQARTNEEFNNWNAKYGFVLSPGAVQFKLRNEKASFDLREILRYPSPPILMQSLKGDSKLGGNPSPLILSICKYHLDEGVVESVNEVQFRKENWDHNLLYLFGLTHSCVTSEVMKIDKKNLIVGENPFWTALSKHENLTRFVQNLPDQSNLINFMVVVMCLVGDRFLGSATADYKITLGKALSKKSKPFKIIFASLNSQNMINPFDAEEHELMMLMNGDLLKRFAQENERERDEFKNQAFYENLQQCGVALKIAGHWDQVNQEMETAVSEAQDIGKATRIEYKRRVMDRVETP